MDIIKNKKYDIFNFYLSKNGKNNFYLNKYRSEIGTKGVIMKYYNFDYINFPNLIKKNSNTEIIMTYNLNLLLFYSYFKKNNKLYYLNKKDINYKFVFFKQNIDYLIKYIFIIDKLNKNKKIFKEYDYNVDNNIIKLILQYIYQLLVHNKKYISDNDIFIKIFYQYYIKFIKPEIYLLYEKKYTDFANFRELYMFLKKKGYVNTFYNKIVPIIKKNYKKVLNNIDFSGIKEFKKKIIKKIKPYSKININKLINEYYPNKKQNKIIKDKLKELTKKLNV